MVSFNVWCRWAPITYHRLLFDVVTADTSQDSSTSAVTSLDDDVKQAISTQVVACARERQSVITDAREALASSTLREYSWYVQLIPLDVHLKPISQLRFDCDTTTTRLRRKIGMFIFCWRRNASNGSRHTIRRSRIVVVSQSNRTRIVI